MKHLTDETRAKMRDAKLGCRHWRAVRPDVERIRSMRMERRMTDTEIAAELGMKRATVGAVLRGTHWSVRKLYRDVRCPEGREPTA
jgi:DNA-binding XRE family transcriptional regulator